MVFSGVYWVFGILGHVFGISLGVFRIWGCELFSRLKFSVIIMCRHTAARAKTPWDSLFKTEMFCEIVEPTPLKISFIAFVFSLYELLVA